jgi:predicted RNA-binding Zn ribbon-like protein
MESPTPQKLPGGLELVRDLINTVDLETGDEALGTVRALRAWLAERGFERCAELREPDRLRAIALRESLRKLLLVNGGGELDPAAPAELVEAAGRSALLPAVEADGTVTLVPEQGGVDALAARLLEVVARAQRDGTWSRMKACPAEPCGWAFYDESRNRSRTWCSMEVCGNRTKTRRYRSRKHPAGAADGAG